MARQRTSTALFDSHSDAQDDDGDSEIGLTALSMSC
jgi:hypothetical protein